MKTNELMIGDWVNTPKGNYQIDCIQDNDVVGTTYKNGEGVESLFGINKIEPIPLTPEILEKNGFVANKHVYPYPYYEYEVKESKVKVGFAFPQGNRTSYKEPWVYIDTECAFIEHLPCIFVHQLQQELRLCGIEKEIML